MPNGFLCNVSVVDLWMRKFYNHVLVHYTENRNITALCCLISIAPTSPTLKSFDDTKPHRQTTSCDLNILKRVLYPKYYLGCFQVSSATVFTAYDIGFHFMKWDSVKFQVFFDALSHVINV